MATKVLMPQMGESVLEGTLKKWLKKVGDAVARDEPLFEISAEKVDSGIPSPASGVLSEILVPEGKTVLFNTVLAIIRETDAQEKEDIEDRKDAIGVADQMPAAKAEPGTEGPPVAGEAEIIDSFAAPDVGQLQAAPAGPSIQIQDIRTSPLVRRLARENNIDLGEIHGTGPEGRIMKDDLLRYIAQSETVKGVQPEEVEVQSSEREAMASETVASAANTGGEESAFKDAPPAPETMRFRGETKTESMVAMRKAIAEHMVISKQTSAHAHTFFEVDMSAVVQLRELHKVEFMKREGVPLAYSPFFAKALVDVVREFPIFNSSVSGESIIYKKPINLGIAMALDTGLIVPTIKDAHLKSFTGLALAICDLAERARHKRLKSDDVQNGTISMTNSGSHGGLFAAPIIHQPQVAILGIGNIEKRPVVIHDAIAIRSMAYLSLTFDQRVIDGAVADRFMARLKERLQSWIQWID